MTASDRKREAEYEGYPGIAHDFETLRRENEALRAALGWVVRTWVEGNLCPFGVSYNRECACNYHAAETQARAAAVGKP